MEAIKENKGLIAIAVLLALLVGVSAYNSNNSNKDSAKSSTETAEQKTADDKDKNKQPAAADEAKVKESQKQSDAKKASDESESAAKSDEADQTNEAYTYVAQPGDSYSVLARKAVQTYGIVNGVKLSLAEILAAEAKLTNEAAAEYLNESQSVSIKQANVKSAIDYAQNLSDEEEAAWATYVPYVNFDTRNNGEK